MFSRDECKITFSFREKPKCLTRAYVFNLVCISHVQFCCFGEPRGKVEEHLLNGNLQPNYTTNKKNNTSPWKSLAFRIKLLAG